MVVMVNRIQSLYIEIKIYYNNIKLLKIETIETILTIID